jgi:hypothetical protein
VFDIVELISQTVVLPVEFVNKFLWRRPGRAMYGRHQQPPTQFVSRTQALPAADALVFAPVSRTLGAIIGIAWGGRET